MNEEEKSATSLFATAYRDLNQLCRLDESMEQLKSDYEEAQLKLNDVVRVVRDYQESLSFDPERLSEVEKRLDTMELMKRKYGKTITEIQQFFDQAKKQYDQLVNVSFYEKEIEQEIEALAPKMKKMTAELTKKRKQAGEQLQKLIESELQDLSLPNAR